MPFAFRVKARFASLFLFRVAKISVSFLTFQTPEQLFFVDPSFRFCPARVSNRVAKVTNFVASLQVPPAFFSPPFVAIRFEARRGAKIETSWLSRQVP
jgi:hypothetical protein